MDQKTRETLLRLDRELEAWFEQLETYTHEQLNTKARNGGWSAMQCIWHILTSERGTLAYIEKKLSFKPDLPNKGWQDAWRRILLVGYLRSPVKFKAPKGVSDEYFPASSTLVEAKKAWSDHRENLKKSLEKIPDEYYKKQVFKHPLSGRISIATTLAFFLAHFERHRRQAMRVLNEQNGQ